MTKPSRHENYFARSTIRYVTREGACFSRRGGKSRTVGCGSFRFFSFGSLAAACARCSSGRYELAVTFRSLFFLFFSLSRSMGLTIAALRRDVADLPQSIIFLDDTLFFYLPVLFFSPLIGSAFLSRTGAIFRLSRRTVSRSRSLVRTVPDGPA